MCHYRTFDRIQTEDHAKGDLLADTNASHTWTWLTRGTTDRCITVMPAHAWRGIAIVHARRGDPESLLCAEEGVVSGCWLCRGRIPPGCSRDSLRTTPPGSLAYLTRNSVKITAFIYHAVDFRKCEQRATLRYIVCRKLWVNRVSYHVALYRVRSRGRFRSTHTTRSQPDDAARDVAVRDWRFE